MLGWFRKPNYVVELQGGPVIVNGVHCDLFVTHRYVGAANELDAGVTVSRLVRDEFARHGVTLLGEILVKNCRPVRQGESTPKKVDVSFIEHAEDSQAFFDMLVRSFPGEHVERLPDGVLFKTSDESGFDVSIEYADFEYTVAAKTWHGHYSDQEQAEWCIRWLFSPYYRVVEETRGGEWIGAWLERWMPEGWQAIEPTLAACALSVIENGSGPFLVTYTQQAVAGPPNYQKFVPGAVLDERDLPPGCILGVTAEELDSSRAARLECTRELFKHLGSG